MSSAEKTREQKIEEIEMEYDGVNNKFLRCFMAVLVNTPFKETDKLEGRARHESTGLGRRDGSPPRAPERADTRGRTRRQASC